MVVGVVGGIAGLVGIVISIRSDRRSTKAEKQAALNKQDGLWGDMIRATHPFIGANVLATDMRPILLQFRTAGTDLLDGLPEARQKPVGEWLDAGRLQLSTLSEFTMLKLGGESHTADEVVEAHHDLNQVAAALINNLRFMRKMAPEADITESMAKLTESAVENREEVKRWMANV